MRLLIQSGRGIIYGIFLLLAAGHWLLSPLVLSYELLILFSTVGGLGLILHLAVWFFFFQLAAWVHGILFCLDFLGLFLLLATNTSHQALFLFDGLALISFAGILLGGYWAFFLAGICSLMFSGVSFLGTEIRGTGFLFLLVLNNLAIFGIAGISTYLRRQIQDLSEELSTVGLSLERLRRLQTLIVENIPVGILSVDAWGRVIQANPFVQKIFGRRWIAEELTEKEKALFENSKKSDGQWVMDGQTKIISTQTQDIEEQNEKMTLYFVQDLTQQRQLESQVRQSEKLAAVGGLAAGIAHEIRNPLASISGSIELLGSQAQSEDDKTLMKIILKEIDRLNLLISDFLDYAKPEKNPVDLVSLKNLLLETLKLLEKDPRVQGRIRIFQDLQSEASILGDAQKLQQVLMNLLINAIQAMDKTADPQIQISLSQSLDHQVLLRIKDNGCGMNEKTKSKLFEPFYTTKSKGTGLGLAMSHKILQSHRCRIVVESQEGLGTEFLLFFPLVTK